MQCPAWRLYNQRNFTVQEKPEVVAHLLNISYLMPEMKKTHYNLVLVLFPVAVLLSLIFYLIPLQGLRPSQREAVKIYYADNISPAHQRIISQFNDEYAGRIEVIPVNLPFRKFNTNERKELITRALRSRGGKMDVFAVDQIWVPRFTKWAEPITKYFSGKEIADILPYALTTCYAGHQLVCVPLYIDIGVMYYRRDLLESLPQYSRIEKELAASMTWDQFITLRNTYFRGKPFFIFPGANYEGLICNYLEVFGGNGGRLYGGDRFEINNPVARRSIRLMVDLINKHGITPAAVTSFDDNESYAYAFEHDVPFFRGWPSSLAEFHANPAYAEIAANLEMAALPHFNGHEPAFAFGGWNLMISKYSNHKDEASLFIKYVLSDEAQTILYEAGSYLPILNNHYENMAYTQKHPALSYLRTLMKHGIHRPSHPEYTKISDILSFHINKALEKESSIEEALEVAVRELISNNIPAQ